MVLRLTFFAGGLVEKVDANEKRLEHLEVAKCPHPECPLLRIGVERFGTENER